MRLLLLLIFLPLCECYSQLIDDFSDGNFDANPVWQGDTDNFRVNDDFQLQLNAPDGGTSFLYSTVEMKDSMEWQFYFNLDFSPSPSNALKIFLSLDNIDLNQANGYFLEIGESGSTDAIRFMRLDNGSEIDLASATMGAVGSDPAKARLNIKKDESGSWTLVADYAGGNLFVEELNIEDTTHSLEGTKWFGFDCTYTSTRVDKFFFDDIKVDLLTPDIEAPQLIEVVLENPTCLTASYSESLDDQNFDLTSFGITPTIGNPVSVVKDSNALNVLIIKTQEAFQSGIIYTFCSENVADNSGNLSAMDCTELFLTVSPSPGDLYINEILFNPNTGGADFIELINTSEKFISLKNVSITNALNGQKDEIENDLVLLPNEILAFTEDVENQIDTYQSPFPQNIIFQNLPSFNADEGNISMFVESNTGKILLDSFDYSEDLHFVLLDTPKGVSLEKINPTAETNASGSWQSASESVRFASPGYANSNFFTPSQGESRIHFENHVFSPNGDGEKDFLIISFNLETPGYLANVKIFDDRGYPVKELSSNQLIGSNSFITWDGITDEGASADIGIYIVLIELIDVNGIVEQMKKSIVLADFLD